jgi:hypothetical protein
LHSECRRALSTATCTSSTRSVIPTSSAPTTQRRVRSSARRSGWLQCWTGTASSTPCWWARTRVTARTMDAWVDALTAGAGRYRGMAVVANDVSRSELAELQSIGVVGVTLNAALLGVEYYADTEPLLANLAALGMIADVRVIDDQLLALSSVLERSGVRVHVDHCGRPDPASGIDAPGFRELLGWGRAGRAVVKLSGCTKAPRSPPSRTRTPTCVPTSARSSRSSDPTTAYGARTGLSCACPNASTTARSWRCSPSRSPTTARARRSCPTLRAANTASSELGCPAVRPRTPGTGCSGRIKGDSSSAVITPPGATTRARPQAGAHR